MVEHVEVVVDIEHNNTGDIRIDLTTPEGYSSRLADARICKTELADPCGKYKNWRFGLKHHLDENPNGTWRMSIRDFLVGNQGNVVSWRLVVYGR
jgi:subtilisin-like proprotein convertase family protein